MLGVKFGDGSRIGRSLIFNIGSISIGQGAKIGNLNIIRNLDRLELGSNSKIGTFNWIAGTRKTAENRHFLDFPERRSELCIGSDSAIIARHIIDCTDAVHIGRFSTIAGHRSQIITHGIDIGRNKQSCAPVSIGDFCMTGTGVIILKGSALPSYSILGAGSVLTEEFSERFSLYAGNPAVLRKAMPCDSRYFTRKTGFVD